MWKGKHVQRKLISLEKRLSLNWKRTCHQQWKPKHCEGLTPGCGQWVSWILHVSWMPCASQKYECFLSLFGTFLRSNMFSFAPSLMVMESSGNLLALRSALLSIHTWWAWSCTCFYPFHRGSQLKPQSWVYIEIQFPILTTGKIASNFTRPRLYNLVNGSVKYLGFFCFVCFFFSPVKNVFPALLYRSHFLLGTKEWVHTMFWALWED